MNGNEVEGLRDFIAPPSFWQRVTFCKDASFLAAEKLTEGQPRYRIRLDVTPNE
jgi:hypothetical protein